MSWQTRASRTVYENRWISVREDEVTGPAGEGIYGVMTVRQPAVFVVAVDDDDRVCLVTLERYTTGRSVEIPAGGTDGEAPEVAARRELREETGLDAETLEHIGFMYALNGICDAPEHVFLARGLHQSDAAATQADEGIDAVSWVPFADALAMIARGEITDGESVAALMYAAIALGRIG